jgi:hypothetical protein
MDVNASQRTNNSPTNDAFTYGEVVWSWRRDADAKFATTRFARRADDGGKKARSPGRARISRQTIAQGRPECFGSYLW